MSKGISGNDHYTKLYKTEMMQKYSSSENLKNYLLSLLNQLETEERTKGLPLIFKFQDDTIINDIKLDNKFSLLTNIVSDVNNKDVFFFTKPGARSYWKIQSLPYSKILKIDLHPDYKTLNQIENTGRSYNEILSHLFNKISLNNRKTIVLEFIDFVYLPGYSLHPVKSLKTDIGNLELCWDNSKIYKPTVVFYAKGSSSKKFYKASYFPFEKCYSWEILENYLFKEGKKNLTEQIVNKEEIKKEFEVKIRTTKTANSKEIIIKSSDFIDQEKIEGFFPLMFAFKFAKLTDRTHENCLVCGTKLFSDDQLYVHLLNTGNLTSIPGSFVDNHFNYFPVGKECLSQIPEEYLFTKTDLIRSNRK